MSKDEKKITVVIPVYNVEDYVERCLKSVINQSYENIEVIIVNDGSTDLSEKVILDTIDGDDRFKYFFKENGGLSSARNFGIEKATGDYISFIDSDDWIHEDFLRLMIESIQSSDSDIAVCNMSYIFSNNSEKKRTPLLIGNETVSNITGLRDLFNGKKFKFHAQNKIYKINLFKNNLIFYPNGKIYEDVFTTYKLFWNAKKISYVPKKLYFYQQNRPGSILATNFNSKRFDILDALDDIKKLLEENKLNLSKDFEHLVVINIISLVNYLASQYSSFSDTTKMDYLKIFSQIPSRYNCRFFLKNSEISIIEKIRFYLIVKNLNFYVHFMNLINKFRSFV